MEGGRGEMEGERVSQLVYNLKLGLQNFAQIIPLQ